MKSIRHVASSLALVILPVLPLPGQSATRPFPIPAKVLEFPDLPLRASIKQELQRFPEVDPVLIGRNGTPTMLVGSFGVKKDALPAVAKLFGLTSNQLKLKSEETDGLGYRHLYYEIEIRGIPVVGGLLILHFNSEGDLYCVNGNVPDETRPLPNAAAASLATARAALRQHRPNVDLSFKNERLVWYINGIDQSMELAWEMPMDAGPLAGQFLETAYVSAESGEVVEILSQVFEANRSVRDSKGDYGYVAPSNFYVPNAVARSEGGGATSSLAVNSGYDNAGRAHNYFSSKFGLNSMDGAGGTANIIVNSHFYFNGPTGNNALYVRLAGFGDTIYLGNRGSRYQFDLSPNYAGATDIVGHEWTHGVLANRPIGSLGGGNNDTGALNEGLADVFGAMTELHSGVGGQLWLLGEHVGAIRSLENPGAYGTADYYPTRNPSADPHINATIPGLAFKLLASGGTHPNPSGKPTVNVPALGTSGAESVFFRAAYHYLPPNTTMVHFKAVAAQAARDLYGSDGEFRTNLAFDAVGVPYDSVGSIRAINMSTRGHVGTGAEQMIAGFVMSGGGTKEMLIRAVGPTLAQYGVSGTIPDPALDLKSSGGSTIQFNDNWGQNSNPSYIATRSSQLGAFALPSGSLDAAMLPTLGGGLYSAVVGGAAGQTGTGLVEVYDGDLNNPLRLINVSTRLKVTPSSQGIVGFVIQGNKHKRVLLRAAGPALTAYGISGVLANPRIALHWNGHEIYTNDDWSSAWNASEISSVASQVGAFAFANGSADSALVVNLPPGLYSAVVTGSGGGTGIALLEFYEVP